MISSLKRVLYQFRLKAAPRLSRFIPAGFRKALKLLLSPPKQTREKLPFEAGAYPSGVNLFGYLKAQMGLGQGARLYARALEKSDISHVFLNTTVGNAASHHDNEFSSLLSERPVFNTNLIHVNAEQMPIIYAAYPESTWDKRYNIGIWLWELEVFPEEWMGAFRYLDEIWTPSTFTSRAIATISPIPVTTIPYGISADTDPAFTRDTFGLPADCFLFLTLYDVKSIMTRKNPLGAIDAFLRAFDRNDTGVGLVIKVNNAEPENLAFLKNSIDGRHNVYIINKTLSRSGVNSLIQCSDALVSLHRSEGFGLVIAEAMYLGIPVIATNWSANTDFMNAENSCPVDYRLIDTGSDYYMSKSGQRWADPDLTHAAGYMRRLVTDENYRRQVAEAGQISIMADFSLEKSSEKMKARLTEIGLIS